MSQPSSIPSTRTRFRGAIAAGTTLEVASGLCEAIHKAELREIFEELEEAANNGHFDEAFERLKHEFTS